ncbi:MAG: type II 3-dehydroquinate dehydratase [Thiothrix nivea]|nr:MAG: type II 3-dehydroquinate dehydratase [Thiothrix nivea]
MPTVLVLNGPNLNLLGQREPAQYGHTTLADVEQLCRETGERLGVEIDCLQSNHEGVLIEAIHEAGRRVKAGEVLGVVLNAGAYTHTSVALHDAIKGADVPVVEVHISNVHARETFRHHSYLSPVAAGIVVGFGVEGYALAIDGLVRKFAVFRSTQQTPVSNSSPPTQNSLTK